MKRLYIFPLALLYSIYIHAQFLSADEIFYRTSRQSILCPPEKVYLHTDRSSYMAGDTIWMRAHIVDGIAHVPMRLSAYVYVTLQNPFMESTTQVRLKADENGFIYGHIPLPEDLPKGEYSLCAYTQYMKNFDSEYFFKKSIRINSVMNNAIKMETSVEGRDLNIRFINPITGESQKIKNCTASIPSGEINLRNTDEGYSAKIHESENRTILIQAGNYKEFVSFDVKQDYDVSFLPEGGNLVAGAFNRVAFKSINNLGQGESIIGTLRDDNDSILLSFKSIYRGMGTFSFIPQKGKRYKVVCENPIGVQKRFTLPEANDEYTMQVNQIKDKVYVKVLFSPHAESNEKLLVIAHQRGWPVKIGNWKKKIPGLTCNKDDFAEGVASFLLVNETGQIVSERMIFIQKDEPLEGEMTINNSIPEKREKLSLKLQTSAKWWNGDCSVSVTDNNDILPDSCNNILTSLLLSADLRGHIEAPAWYFQKDGTDTLGIRQRALDALMMTQGWRKHDFRKAWAKVYHEPNPLPERSQEIKGKVVSNVTRKAVGKAEIKLMVPDMGIQEETKTGKDGTFVFTGFDAPDSTVYWISALTNKGKSNLTVELDSMVHPILTNRIPPHRNESQEAPYEIPSHYLAKADMKQLYEKGIRHLFLDEVIVTAKQLKQETEYEKNIMGNQSIKEKEINESGIEDLYTFLRQKIPGFTSISVETGGETYTSIGIRNEEVSLLLDGTIYRKGSQGEILKTLYKTDIEQIDFIKSPFSLIYDPMTWGGVLAITTKGGDAKHNAQWITTNIRTIMPLGFQQPVAFYVPRYETVTQKENRTPDLRTTIHWQPHLEVKNGKAELEFYTADSPVDYTVIIEGVGEDGSLLRIEKRIGENISFSQ